MHENLKYTVSLDESIKKYSENIISDPMEDKFRVADWQAIYSGFDYNTHYLIYAKFIGQKKRAVSLKLKRHNYIFRITMAQLLLDLILHLPE